MNSQPSQPNVSRCSRNTRLNVAVPVASGRAIRRSFVMTSGGMQGFL